MNQLMAFKKSIDFVLKISNDSVTLFQSILSAMIFSRLSEFSYMILFVRFTDLRREINLEFPLSRFAIVTKGF